MGANLDWRGRRRSRTREMGTMAKRGNKRRARKKKKSNHGKRPNA
ncbi:hypothetical protein AB0D30_02420 [Streptomyces sp. NPDC048409]